MWFCFESSYCEAALMVICVLLYHQATKKETRHERQRNVTWEDRESIRDREDKNGKETTLI